MQSVGLHLACGHGRLGDGGEGRGVRLQRGWGWG